MSPRDGRRTASKRRSAPSLCLPASPTSTDFLWNLSQSQLTQKKRSLAESQFQHQKQNLEGWKWIWETASNSCPTAFSLALPCYGRPPQSIEQWESPMQLLAHALPSPFSLADVPRGGELSWPHLMVKQEDLKEIVEPRTLMQKMLISRNPDIDWKGNKTILHKYNKNKVKWKSPAPI